MERGNGTPIVLHDLIMWINQVMKDSSFVSVRNSFEIMAEKFVPYFEGGEILKRPERLKFKEILLKVKYDAFLKQEWSIKEEFDRKGSTTVITLIPQPQK